MNDCIAVNIQDMLKAIGEEELLRLLSDFSCPLNREVEDFVLLLKLRKPVKYLLLALERVLYLILLFLDVCQAFFRKFLNFSKNFFSRVVLGSQRPPER